MFQARFAAATLLVCASLYSQQVLSFDKVLHPNAENAAIIELSRVEPDGPGDERRLFAAASVNPEAISFFEFEDGRYAAVLRIETGGMKAVRLHFSSFALPEGAELYIYGGKPGGNDAGQSSTIIAGPYRATGALDGEFWSDPVPAGVVYLELQVRGDVPGVLPFEMDSVEEVDDWNRGRQELIENATENSREKRRSMFRGAEIEHEVVNGQAIFEGDILLGSIDELAEALPESGKDRSKTAIGITSTNYRWPNGVIPYVIDPSITYPANVSAAVSHWNSKLAGVISLVPRTSEKDYVRFIGGSSCLSYMGRVGGVQNITLMASCATGNIIHEIGHAVGLYHEQSREDRNAWVKINTENVSPSSLYNFNQFPSTTDDLIYYSYNSIMHYHSTAFTSNGLATIETIPAGIPIGQRAELDISDIAAVRKMYGKQTSEVSVSTVPAGLTLTVDGASVVTPATFNWPAGSVHTITAPSVATTAGITPSRYGFVRWSDGGGLSHTITVPSTGLAVAATYSIQHKLTTSIATASTGVVSASPASSDTYYAQGKTVNLAAIPASGYCFNGWNGLAAGTSNDTTVAMSRSLSTVAKFIVGAVTPATTAVSVAAAGGTLTMDTSASTGCGWSVKSLTPWVTVSKSYATSAAPSFTYTVQPNTSGAARTGTIQIDSKNVTITQAK